MKGSLKALWDGVKFVLRMFVLFGIPYAITQITNIKPQWAITIGTVLAFVDKFIHKLPNEWKGIIPF